MRLNDADNNGKLSPKLISVIGGCFAVCIAILLIAIIPNVTKKPSTGGVKNESHISSDTVSTSQEASADLSQNSDIKSPSDLDFWDLYPEESQETIPEVTAGDKDSDKDSDKNDAEVAIEDDPSTDGKHTLVTLRDGSEEWVVISQYIPKNDYDYTNLVCKDQEMQYYADGRQASYFGIDISKYQDYIDFAKVRKAGVDFVMIKVGARGYGTGQLTLDDYFYDNIKRATDAGLQVGVYFSSQAITIDEAVEEAEMVIEAIGDYRLDYPIAFDMEYISNDVARIESLTNGERTEIAKAFLDYISGCGYTGMLYGNKEWLIKEIDMTKLTAYDVWYASCTDLPDYPYKYSIWQYNNLGSIDGITGYVNLNISFVDYSQK